MKAAGNFIKIKSCLGLQVCGGLYSTTPKCENTKLPKILAYIRDKVVMYQNEVVWHQEFQKHRGSNFAMQGDFASIAKISLA